MLPNLTLHFQIPGNTRSAAQNFLCARISVSRNKSTSDVYGEISGVVEIKIQFNIQNISIRNMWMKHKNAAENMLIALPPFYGKTVSLGKQTS